MVPVFVPAASPWWLEYRLPTTTRTMNVRRLIAMSFLPRDKADPSLFRRARTRTRGELMTGTVSLPSPSCFSRVNCSVHDLGVSLVKAAGHASEDLAGERRHLGE